MFPHMPENLLDKKEGMPKYSDSISTHPQKDSL